jgi:raffinose/stachyose/melibiose transport system permease protein
MNGSRTRELWLQIIFIGPALLFFTAIIIIPFALSLAYSTLNWDGISDNMTFVGINNFRKLLHDDYFIDAFWFTARFSAASVILGNLLAFVLALILTTALKLKNVYRAVFFLPNVISGFILGFIWQFIYVKVFMSIGESTGIPLFQLPWLGTHETGFWATVIVQLWQMSGYLMVIYIAGLTSVSKELLESAHMDGANYIQTLINVRLPMIMPSITVSLFLSINSAFKMFDLNFSLTHGNFDTRGLALDIYNEAFASNNYGLGTAKAVFFFVVVAAITVVQTLVTKRREVQA